ncbi:hypothetical protein PPL_04671 [Heterostelium album PN500]|uniref:Uncharacterized protein n=1 Tax=Heterostelium pallidum (strain ATCC 26659 / Pp 5 / PN500) TaxID=670386 RepID=D3B880_HETP5|nr:hypothetical protein PPL_04671 [Heterostelium album PN500]EFA82248.1 hypothetical protein PPL_04671 [Heterostelium album PN500]|eukprot:XP_020434365.1 hypothetical protein PPL_04671 [Heterostelium album PN500]
MEINYNLLSPPSLQLNNTNERRTSSINNSVVGPIRSHQNNHINNHNNRNSYLYLSSYIPYGMINSGLIATSPSSSSSSSSSLGIKKYSSLRSTSGQSSEVTTPEMCSQKYNDLFSVVHCRTEEFERIKTSLSSMAIKIKSNDLWQDDIDDDNLISLASMYCKGKWKTIGKSLLKNKRYNRG